MARAVSPDLQPTRDERKGAGDPEEGATAVSTEVAPGEVVGDYRVEEVIGSGTFGVVVRATHVALGREVALKVLRRRFAADAEVLGRFAAEARAVSQLRHPNIVDVYGFGALPDGRHYHVMDLLHGESLASRLGAGERLSLEETLRLLRPLCEALAAAHARGVTHRDLKPENVFLVSAPGGVAGAVEVRLLDFGVAHIPRALAPDAPGTQLGMVLGTPSYMAPEQALGERVDARTDVYALGVMAYRMLTGQLPLEGPGSAELLRRQLHGPPPAAASSLTAGLPAHVDAALAWMLAAGLDARCPDVKTALHALEGAVASPRENATVMDRRSPGRSIPGAAAFAISMPSARGADDPPLPSLVRLADEEVRASRWGYGRLSLALALVAALFAGGLYALDRRASAPADEVTFTFEGRPARAEIVTTDGRRLGQLPGTVRVRRIELPLQIIIRAPGHAPERRTLEAGSPGVQLVTLRPAR